MIEIDSILIHGFLFVCFVLVLLTYLAEVFVLDKITHGNFSHRDVIIKLEVCMFG